MNAIDNVVAFQETIWCRDGDLALDVVDCEPLKLVSEDSKLAAEIDDVANIEARNRKCFLDRQRLEKVDLLKLDSEGAE